MSQSVEFDPSAAAQGDSGIFGLPFGRSESALVLLPVPWEATTSYGGGTSRGPAAILRASHQLDLFDLDVDRPYRAGICMLPEADVVRRWNDEARALSMPVIERGGAGGDPALLEALSRVNALGARCNEWVRGETAAILSEGRIPGIVGGDHSVPLGAFEAVAAHHGSFGILHFDAHSDTRDAYEGFQFSHASIMRNALDRVPGIERIVQVGIRDFCEEEMDYLAVQGKRERARVFFDADLQRRGFEGEPWNGIAGEIVASLPQHVWVSFDIDGLDPRLCPHTGTPVPGGLDFAQANHVLRRLALSGRRILGFDLNEVSPGPEESGGEWDANVGMRLLYRLCAWTLLSQGKVAQTKR